MKHYSLNIYGGNRFSLSNDTDHDAMSDYYPGIWGIKSMKSAISYAKDLITAGDKVTIDCSNAAHFSTANKIIKALNLDTPLFKVPDPLPVSKVTNGMPDTLAALKRKLVPDTKIKITNFTSNGPVSRDTFVKKNGSTSLIVDKNGSGSYLDWGKATDWTFDNAGATKHYMDSKGIRVKSTRIDY